MPKDRKLDWLGGAIEDNLHQHPLFTQAIVRAFPNGPPNAEVGEAVLQAEIEATCKELMASTLTAAEVIPGEKVKTGVDTESRYEVLAEHGISYVVNKQGRNKWRMTVTSPKSPNDKTVTVTQLIPGDKISAMIALGLYLAAATQIRLNLMERIKEQEGVPLNEVPEGTRKLVEVIRYPYEQIFDAIYRSFTKSTIKEINDHASGFVHQRAEMESVLGMPLPDGLLPVNFPTSDDAAELSKADIVITSVMHLHEMWKMKHEKQFSEEIEQAMAKNNGEHIWWLITGGRKPMNKVMNTLQSNRHFLVLSNEETCYLRIQNSESPFVKGLAAEYNCRAKLCDEPDGYGETICGKLHLNPGAHQGKCNACARVRANADAAKAAAEAKDARETAEKAEQEAKLAQQEAASQNKQAVANEAAHPSTSSPDGKFTSGVGSIHPRNPVVPPRTDKRAEEKEWAAKNGAVITVQGAKTGIDPMDFSALAEDYRRISDELLERANYYSTLAERYEALLQPSDKVLEAERLLAEAKASEETDKTAKVEALMSLIAEGPPDA